MSNASTLNPPDQRSDRNGDGRVLIYVYGRRSDEFIKIGKTTRPAAARRRQHEGSAPNAETLDFLAAVAGKDSDEQRIKSQFRQHLHDSKRSTEWFKPAPEILAWINWLRRQYYCALTEDDAVPELMERVSSELWLPNDTNTNRPPSNNLTLLFSGRPWDIDDEPATTGDDYYTNEKIIDAARSVMGRIDLDPASHPVANRIVKADKFYTINDNGLASPWAGRVWCNPPFGQWKTWGPKIASEWQRGDISQMCVLFPSRAVTALSVVDTFLPHASRIAITRGRIPFWGPHAAAPDDGHVIAYFGTNTGGFESAFRELAFITTPAVAA